MLYLGIENQIVLMIIICFSFYIFISSLLFPSEDRFIKQFGLAFISPLVLCLTSFITLQYEKAAVFLFFAEFCLVIGIFFTLLIHKTGELSELLSIVLFILPFALIVLVFNLSVPSTHAAYVIFVSLLLGIVVVVLISQLLMKKNNFVLMYLGLAAILSSILLFRTGLRGAEQVFGLLVKFIGYCLLAAYYQKNTITRLHNQYKAVQQRLRRMDNSLQREVSRRVTEIEKSNQKLVEIARTDKMTNTFTKQAIIDFMENNIKKGNGAVFSVIMFDIDKFKGINDTLGHTAGDKCIKLVARIAKNALRENDFLGRYGGDEFIILLPDTNITHAQAVAERFRKKVEETRSPNFTVSIGISSYPTDGKTTKDLIDSADQALYLSKELGRNRISIMSHEE